MVEQIVNFSEPRERAALYQAINQMTGVMRVTFKKYRKRRTDAQNRLYWVAVVPELGRFLRDQGESYTDEDAHELMKAKFLRETVVNKQTGEAIGVVIKSTTKLTTQEFSEYIEKCVAWLADMFHIQCTMPGDMGVANRH